MFERTRAEARFLIALLAGSTVGGILHVATQADDIAEFFSVFSVLYVVAIGVLGTIVGMFPFLAVGVPVCLFIEYRISSPIVRTTILTAGGAGIGAAIGISIDHFLVLATMAGGCTGLVLGILRRHVIRSPGTEPLWLSRLFWRS